MRIIGHLPSETSAVAFSDFLCVQGISNEVEAEKDGWAVWIHCEDEIATASDLLLSYLRNPADPKFHKHARRAREIREKDQRAASEVEAKHFDRETVFRAGLPYRPGPLTLVLIFASVILAVLSRLGANLEVLVPLLIASPETAGAQVRGWDSLIEVRNGEVWRLLTPIFIHWGPLHLFFNMWWLLSLGSLIEARQSTGRLAWLVLVVAVLSNLAEFWATGPRFGGMSGVVYGLLGYIWIKSRLDPGSGLHLDAYTVAMMLVWFFLCWFKVIPNVANTVHGVGLVMGMACGFLASLSALRRFTK